MKLLFILSILTNSVYADNIVMNHNHYDEHGNYWKIIPEIVICKSQTVFTEEQVKHAVSMWNEKYTNISSRTKCDYSVEYGKIKIIDGKLLKKNEWGYTAYFYRDVKINNRIVREHDSALVQLNRNVSDVALLVHEIGHAYGHNHYDEKPDVMNTYGSYNVSGNYPY